MMHKSSDGEFVETEMEDVAGGADEFFFRHPIQNMML